MTVPDNNGPTAADKMLTFRKRRLSLPLHHLAVGEEEDHSLEQEAEPTVAKATASIPFLPPAEDKAHTFRKRRLSLTLKQDDTSDLTSEGEPGAKRRRSSVASAASAEDQLKSRTLHAAELLHCPPSPAVVGTNNILYHQRHLPPPNIEEPHPHVHKQPKWKQRHTNIEDHKLPFSRDIVGTYSCHGVEPVYDSDYDHDDDEEDDGDDEWVPKKAARITNEKEQVRQVSQEELPKLPVETDAPTDAAAAALAKPTTAAKINQDRGGVAFPYGNSPHTALFGVYDGHGQGGEHVSQFCLHEIQRRLEKHKLFRTNLEQAFKETFCGVDTALKAEPCIEPLFCGTTACVALLRGQTLTVANAGDSRAVLACRKQDDNKYDALDLTLDQNPDLAEEQARIRQMGGYVSAPPGPGLSARVWLDAECTQIGLAMARSIGDHAVSTVGVIAEPVVTSHELDESDELLILASDGVWEFLSSQDAVQIVTEHLDKGATKACQALIEAAAARWHEEEGDYRDDITALVVRLQHLWDDEAKDKSSTRPQS